jgi:hypothetical protein
MIWMMGRLLFIKKFPRVSIRLLLLGASAEYCVEAIGDSICVFL